jgi:hypothetical protein
MRWLFCLALVLALLFLWNGLRSAPPSDRAGTLDLSDHAEMASPEHSSEPEVLLAPPEDITRAVAGLPMTSFEGTVVVRFVGGPPVDDASGSFELSTVLGERRLTETVQVHGGSFRVTVPVGAKMYVLRPRFDGRAARLGRPEVQPHADGRLKIRAFWYPVAHLHVRDVDTGMALSGISFRGTAMHRDALRGAQNARIPARSGGCEHWAYAREQHSTGQ